VFAVVTLCLALPCWHVRWLHGAMLAGVTTASAWGGASFFFDVFARRWPGWVDLDLGWWIQIWV
jgi:hypothetical protein